MAFGPNLYVEGITLRKPLKSELGVVSDGMSDMHVNLYTSLLFAKTQEDEEEWYERMRKSDTDCLWAVVPDDADIPIGVTAIHRMDHFGSCSTGIILWDDSRWGEGIASRTHLARTLFAADYLHRRSIFSSVRVPNEASLKALLRVGYFVWGIQPQSIFRAGTYLPTYHLAWFNPEMVSQNELAELGKLAAEAKKAMVKANLALISARDVVKLKKE